MSSVVTGESPVGGSGSGGTVSTQSHAHRKVSASSKKVKKSPKLHNVTDNVYSTNRRGVNLCRDYQDGNCTEHDGHRRCARDPSRMHQCYKCLGFHSGKDCNQSPKPVSKGRGKGKGKGRGRKGAPY